jgi:DNA-binding transcriptional LysR family regulator
MLGVLPELLEPEPLEAAAPELLEPVVASKPMPPEPVEFELVPLSGPLVVFSAKPFIPGVHLDKETSRQPAIERYAKISRNFTVFLYHQDVTSTPRAGLLCRDASFRRGKSHQAGKALSPAANHPHHADNRWRRVLRIVAMKNVHGTSVLDGLDLNLLYVFHVVYRERSVSQAAAILSVSQSAVSHAIGRLRTRLGASLFELRGRNLVPTPMADRLAPAVAAALATLVGALATRSEFDPQRHITRLTVAMPSQLEPLLFPNLVEQLSQRAPGIMVQSVRLDRPRMKRDLENGVIDLALDVTAPNDPELSSECLFEDTLCVVSAQAQIDAVDRAAYLAARHVAVASRRRGPSLVDVLLIQDGIRRNIAVRCQLYEAACRIAASSDLLLTMGSQYAKLLASAIPVSIVPLDASFPSYRVHLYWLQRRDDDATVFWIRSVLRDIAIAIRE